MHTERDLGGSRFGRCVGIKSGFTSLGHVAQLATLLEKDWYVIDAVAIVCFVLIEKWLLKIGSDLAQRFILGKFDWFRQVGTLLSQGVCVEGYRVSSQLFENGGFDRVLRSFAVRQFGVLSGVTE